MPSIGPFEMVIIFLVVLIIFGPKSLPKIGQALGRGIREFKDATRGITSDLEEDQRRQVPPPAGPQVVSPASPQPSENTSTSHTS